jgi:hypothetical protein
MQVELPSSDEVSKFFESGRGTLALKQAEAMNEHQKKMQMRLLETLKKISERQA